MNTDMMNDFDGMVRRAKSQEVLHAVWLYDEDEAARKLVDESAEYGVYAHEALRKQDATLHSYGEDYARAVVPELAEEPMGLVEQVLDRMPEGRRGVYRGEFDRLRLSGNDRRQDYYALYARMVRDEVRGAYEARKQAEAQQKALLEQQAQEYERLIAGGMSGAITAPSPEQFELLARGGVPWESIQKARRAAGLAKGDRVSQQHAADMLEGDEIARQLVLQEVARSSKEHREDMEGSNYFSSLFWYGPLRTLEHVATKVDKYLPRSSQTDKSVDLTRPQLLTGEVLTSEQQETRRQHRDAFMGDVLAAREAGVAEAEKGIGWKFSHIPSNLARMGLDLGEFMHPATRAASIAQFAEESYHRNMAAGRSVAMNAAEFERLREEQGWDVAVRTAAQREEAASMAQVYAKTAVNTLAYWASLKVGTQHVGKAAFTALPFTRRLLPGLAKVNATRTGAFVSSTTASAIDLAVMDGVSGAINSLYECLPGVDEKLDSGLAELSALWANLGKTQTWVETVAMAGLMGGGLGARHTRAQSLELLRERQGALRAGLTAKQFDSVAHLEPSKRDDALLEMVRDGMEKDAAGMVQRAIDVSRAELNRERAMQMRGDKAVTAAMEQLGISMREADDGVYIHYDGSVDSDGSFVPGEKSVKVSREDADVYLQAVLGSQLEGMAGVLRRAAGSKRLLDAFRDDLKGEVRVEWMYDPDNLAKFEGWKARALERIDKRVSELMVENGLGVDQARTVAEGEIHQDITDRGTLGEIVNFASNMRERFEQEQARAGVPLDPRAFGSRANVTRQRSADGSQLRRVLRIATDARVDEIAEELGEQVMHDWREYQGMSVSEAYRHLRQFADWAAKSENPAVAKAAGMLMSLHKTHPELAERLMRADFNEYDLTVDEYRAVERELTEAGSTLMLSQLRQAAADNAESMPDWARDLFSVADLSLLELERDMNLAMAMEQARQEGVLPEVAQKLFGAGREAVEKALAAEPETPEYHNAWYEVQKRQGELDAAYGAGLLTEPGITEEFEVRAREGQESLELERERQEEVAAASARERLEEFKREPENADRPHDEIVREVAERAADATEERLAGEPGSEQDDAFSGGRCIEIADESGLVCKSGLLEVGKLHVLPNFKLGADAESGVVHPLKGDYRPDHDPIRVWRKAGGELLVISGRHRLEAARRAGATRISAYVYDESEVRDLSWARRYDIESNIRDNQATPLEVALYVRGEFTDGKPLSDEQVERAGITREGKLGSIGFRIGRRAGESVMDALRNGQIDDRVALWIADFCPGNDAVQRRGLEAALREASKAEILARMEAELAKQQMQEEMGLDGGMDLFGNTLDNDEFMDFVAQYVLRRRNELAQDASYLNATAKKRNAEAMGKKYGVDVKDPVALKKKLDEINALRERWKNPYSDSELMDEIRNAWRSREVVDLPADAMESKVETPSEQLFREYAAREWQTEGVDYCVIGEHAVTWDKYDESQKFKGRDDGRMRVELDASQFRFVPRNRRGATLSHERYQAKVESAIVDAMEAAFKARDQGLRRMNAAFEKTLDSHVPDVYSTKGIIQDYLIGTEAFDRDEAARLVREHKPYDIKTNLSRTWMLEDILKADELYEAYPQLRSVLVQEENWFNPLNLGAADGFIITINANRLSRLAANPRKVLLHEVQHLVQRIEGFARGSNPGISYQDFQEEYKRIKKEVIRLRRSTDAAEGVLEEADRKLAAFGEIERRYKGNRIGFEQFLHSATLGLFPRLYTDGDLYALSAGETESRNVETRANWSAKKRRKVPFNATLDVPAEQIVVRTLQDRRQSTLNMERNVTHFSICGLRAKTANEYLEKGADYTDPADGQRKFVIPVAGARLRSDVTPGMMNVAAGGHKDVSLAALLHYPELYRAYPHLAEMRVRLYRPKEETTTGGYFAANAGEEEAAYIAVNVDYRGYMLNTLLHESQHAIQAYEGFARGAGDFDIERALAYIGKAIEQRKAAGLTDDWSKDNLAYLQRLQADVERGEEVALMMTYVMSHGEQEARFTGDGHGKDGANPMDDNSEERLMRNAPSAYTVAVRQNATDLGGVTFLNMGRFGYLLDSRLMPAGEFHFDRRVYQMRENVTRRMRELKSQTDHAQAADGLRLAAEGLAVMESIESLLPNTYRSALEPYKVYFNTYAKLRGSGDAAQAAMTVPMRGWDERMYSAFERLVREALRDGVDGRDAEFWQSAFSEFPKLEAVFADMKEAYAAARQAAEERHPRPLAETNKQRRNRLAQIDYETMEEIRERYPDQLHQLYKAVGSMRADKLMAKFLERVALQLDAFRKDTTLGRIRRVVNNLTPLPGKDGKPVKGRMSADAYNKVMDLMRLLELTKGEKLAFERTRYTGDDGCPDGKLVWAELEGDAQITVETYDADGATVDVTCTKQEYETYACFDGMTASQAESAAKALGEFITTGRQAWENAEELRRQRIARMCAPLLESHAESLNDERRRHLKEKRGEMPHDSWLTRRGFARRMHSLFGAWMNDAQFFDAMSGVPEVTGFARDFTDRIARAKVYLESKEKERRAVMMDAVFEASGAKAGKDAREFVDFINKTEKTRIVLKPQTPDFLRQETEIVRAQFLGLLRRKTHKKNFNPNTFAAMMKHLAKQGEGIIPAHILEEAVAKYGEIGDEKKSHRHGIEALQSVLTMQELSRFSNLTSTAKKRAEKALEKWLEEQKEKNGALRPENKGGLELTRSEAAYRVLLCEQADYEETLRRQGYTEDVVRQLRAFAGDKMMRLAYRLRDELGARTSQIKEVYERVYGMPFPEVENYFRAYFNAGYEVHSEAIMGGAGEGRAAGKGTAKILYTRHHHNAKIDPTMNVLAAFECAMKEQDIMLGYGDLPTDISSVLNYRDGELRMSDALAKVFSSHTVIEMRRIAEDMTRATPTAEEVGRWMTRCLSAMGSSTATALLNYRMATLFKQRTALFNTLAGSDRVSWWEWQKSLGRARCGLSKISIKEMAARPELDGRFKGWSASADVEALLGDADVISAKGATNAAARAGMSLMEWIDMRENVRSCVTLYDAVYRKTQKEFPDMSHEELDADAMNEVRRALAFKSQPLDWRSRALLGSKKTLFSIGNLFLGGESINTMGNVIRLLSRGKKGDKRKAVSVWFTHGAALQALTALYNWMTDDEEQWKRRSVQQYVAGSFLGPLAGLPLVSAFVGAGTGVLNTFLPKEWRVWMPSQSLLPMADMERVFSDLRKVFWGKKPSSWQDKTIAVENFVRLVATFGILASRNPTTAGGARMKAASYGVAAVSNILDFLLRTERAIEERVLD